MLKPSSIFGRLLDRIQSRFNRSRPGSVMILVVTLLVLMALIGTAYISTARTDRAVAKMHSANVQIDMFKQGVQQMVFGSVAHNTFVNNGGQLWDDPFVDTWMASRVPMRLREACDIWQATSSYVAGQWVQFPAGTFFICINRSGMSPGATAPLSPDVDAANWYNIATQEPPAGFKASTETVCWPAVSAPLIPGLQPLDITTLQTYTPTRFLVCPDVIVSGGAKLPALWVFDFNTLHMKKVLAGTASGDGIADSLMWPLHTGEVNGIEYFAAYRVIDGNSAINLNTAGSTFFDYMGNGAADVFVGGGFRNDAIFPGNVGLSELFPMADMTVGTDISQGRDYLSLNAYRHASVPSQRNKPTATVLMDFNSSRPDGIAGPAAGPPILTTPWSDFGQRNLSPHARPDIQYRTEADAQFMSLARRLDSPGPSRGAAWAGGFGWNDAAALAYRFDLVNPTTYATGNLSAAEVLLPDSLLADRSDPANEPPLTYQSAPYSPDQVGQFDSTTGTYLGVYGTGWFGLNYAYEGATSYLDPLPRNRPIFNRRAITTSRNPTNNQMPLSRALYEPGNGIGGLLQLSNLASARGGQTFDQMGVPVGLPVPWPDPRVSQIASDLPPPIAKVNLNTSSVTANDFNLNNSVSNGAFIPFQGPSLWFGFFNVMADASLPLYNRAPNLAAAPPDPGAFPEQFRSVLRDPATPYPATSSTLNGVAPRNLNLRGMLMIRSLIAAANAQAMRDSDDDVKSQTITLRIRDVWGGTSFPPSDNGTMQVTVYPVERQPFITEVYVNNDTAVPPANIPDPTQPDPANPFGSIMLRLNPNTQANPQGYVAVELYNPYDIPINVGGWTLGILNRDTAAAANPYPTMHVRSIIDPGTTMPWFFPANTIIPARGFLTLDNMQPMTPPPPAPIVGAATYRPYEAYAGLSDTVGLAASVSPAVGILFVPNLQQVLRDPANTATQPGGELMLLRPRHANGVANSAYNEVIQDPADNSRTILNPDAMDPVDSFDFTGMTLPPSATAGPFQAWHYTRANTNPNDTLTPTAGIAARSSWRMVFPGRWDATRAIHEDGVTSSTLWNGQMDPNDATKPVYPPASPSTFDPWIMIPPGGKSTGPATTQPTTQPATQPFSNDANAPIALGQPDYSSTAVSNDFLPIQLNNTGFNPLGAAGTTPHGTNKSLVLGGTNTSPNKFPFGGFARVGDVLQVPFIGSYTISVQNRPSPSGYYILEMNSVTRDAALADALAPTALDHSVESIGKLCPISASIGSPVLIDRYGWASHALDCFTAIHSPQMQYFPHVDPNPVDPNAWFIVPGTFYFNNLFWDPVAGSYVDPTTPAGAVPQPELISNSAIGLAPPVEGLINVNTAPWRVLAAIPWKANDGTLQPADLALYNEAIAKSIVAYRNRVGPFRSLFDLNLMPVFMGFAPFDPPRTDVVGFQVLNAPPAASDYDVHQGDFTPNFPVNGTILQPDGLRGDAKERFSTLTRISNLVTTRSDTFTVYVQVQGWRGIATGSPELIVQRRLAFIVDRSGYPAPGYPKITTTIPTD